ncbi:MAG: selenium-dependent molybdenum cofactor biosynthesis protein YqeB [Eubacterium sp.]|jgi:xanthine dehydrogenase accessory factor
MMETGNRIIIRGAGDLSTGTIHRLCSAGFPLLVLETGRPAAIRRQVAFSEAVYDGTATVEGLTARKIASLEEIADIEAAGMIPLLVDPEGESIRKVPHMAVVDAILAKRNLGTSIDLADLVIGLGPGFTAGVDVHAVIETKRGHNLGRIIREGSAIPDTGIPGIIGGYGKERVIHAEEAGILRDGCKIGSLVEQGEPIARICTSHGDRPVLASLTGIVRGMIRDGYPVTRGFKIADIDPRKEELSNCFTISDKARCIAGSVLELVCKEERRRRECRQKMQ